MKTNTETLPKSQILVVNKLANEGDVIFLDDACIISNETLYNNLFFRLGSNWSF